MTIYYVRSTNGTSGDGLSWATAKITLEEVTSIDAAGDTIYVSHAHYEAKASAISLTFAGTASSPTKVYCVDDGLGTLAATAVVSTTGNSSITITGSVIMYGIGFIAGNGVTGPLVALNSAIEIPQYYEECVFSIGGTGSTGRIQVGTVGNTGSTMQRWKNCTVKFAASAQHITLNSVRFKWVGGGINILSVSPTSLFNKSITSLGRSSNVLVEGVDFSSAAAGMNLVSAADTSANFVIRNCKLPTNWSGALLLTPSVGSRVEMYNSDYSDTNYNLVIEDYSGSIRTETTMIATAGASNGTTPYSWKMTSSADVISYTASLESPEISRWNTTVGSQITVEVEIIHDSLVNLTDEDIWLEVQYLGTNGVPQSLTKTDAKATLISAPAAQGASTAGWAAGLTNPNKQKLSVSFTPNEVGYLQAKVILNKLSKIVYVDPKLKVT